MCFGRINSLSENMGTNTTDKYGWWKDQKPDSESMKRNTVGKIRRQEKRITQNRNQTKVFDIIERIKWLK